MRSEMATVPHVQVFKDAKGRALRGSAAYLQWQNSRGGT
jgi:hypothetical protein